MPITYIIFNNYKEYKYIEVSTATDVSRIEHELFYGALWFAIYNNAGQFVMRVNSTFVVSIGYDNIDNV